MNKKRTNYFDTPPIEINTQLNGKGRSNSLLHYKETANQKYKERISLDPCGELKLELRDQIPTFHIQDKILKTNYLNELDEIKAIEKADFVSDINSQIKKQKYQLLLEKDAYLKNICQTKNNEIKEQFENRKKLLEEELTNIIKDSLLFAKKNSPVSAMLPPGAHEFFEKLKNETDNNSLPNNTLRNKSEQKSTKGNKFVKKPKNEFLTLLGLDVNNLSIDNVNVDINKAWNFILTWAKGRNINEILRYKVVNSIMSLTEKNAAEKVKNLYNQLELFNEYKRKLRREERRKRREEERKKQEELKQMDTRELIKLKMRESLGKSNNFAQQSSLTSRSFRKKKVQEQEEEFKKQILKLNAYKDVDLILKFIDSSKKNSQSKFCKDHFNNIKRTKTMDKHIKNLLNKNLIIEKK